MPIPRPDRSGSHQQQFRINKKKIYATQTVCGICGKPVDFSLKYLKEKQYLTEYSKLVCEKFTSEKVHEQTMEMLNIVNKIL